MAGATGAPPPARVMALAPAVQGRLYAVATPSSNEVFAVGLYDNGSLIMRWNGTKWTSIHPNRGYFLGAGGSGARDVWAVGGTNWCSPTGTLAEHWNGSSWKQVATANPAVGGYFNAVAATSTTNAWAVGLAARGGPGQPSPATPLIEHWNGSHWAIQRVPAVPGGGELDGVQALSARNAWAVGWTHASTQQTLIEHWNGSGWTRVPSPNEGTQSFLHAITVESASNAWAVGSFIAADGTNRTLTMHWNGSHWSVIPSQSPGGDDALISVTASWTNNIWAVGLRNPSRCGNGGPKCQTLIEHWNGSHWTLVASPNPPSGYLNVLLGIRAVSRTSIYAVGSTDFNSTLIVHWNGTAWS